MSERLEAVILDWAGTTVDHGCLAPVGVFVEVFQRRGVPITAAEARGPMGTHKREHIRLLTVQPRIAAAWLEVYGVEATDADIDAMYAEGEELQVACLPAYAEPIPGALDAVDWARGRGMKVGSTTGYNRVMLDVLLTAAAQHGYHPDVAIAANEVAAGRPMPYMNWLAAEQLGVRSAAGCVVVGDTLVDVEAARAAGMWAVGVAWTGNELGLTARELEMLSDGERYARGDAAADRLRRAGAHLVIPSIADLPGAVLSIEARANAGERP